ncbi:MULTISPECIES: acyl-CoA carboxylase subunit beta [Burkholderia]|uniref:Methylmalonyl-CoA carboxyltransferase n=1 Tax=Burkholderia mayonis TaxID=1385591 RepID=A0A1B4FDS4_9BURK|nr:MULTISPECIES: acyl-CoA carboxylase subunit beta [Burkholderia]AOJ01860.1 methylmalonyl-CoA carboxyltransferase [Burkholderia mayonis]KVE43106.1 methylmalonyl-CoA carboxyltransferase [Burkholderia sp. BDU5]KVE47279.1 methylmalonyl-CoA carboxyltransferase [Burkholderia mayonis]
MSDFSGVEERSRERQAQAAEPPAHVRRIRELLDPGSFRELDALAEHDCTWFGADRRKQRGDGIATGHGTIGQRPVLVYAHDGGFLGGSSSRVHALKIGKVLDLALRIGVPVVALNHSSGLRIHEGVDADSQFSHVFYKTVRASGVVPQVSLILGDCVGGAAYTPALTDFIVMVDQESALFLTGPAVIRRATGEEVTREEIGGGHLHAAETGLAHFLVESGDEALALARELLSYLPQNNASPVPPTHGPTTLPRTLDGIADIVPVSKTEPFDVRELIELLADDRAFLEVHRLYARNIVVGFARIGGQSVGIVANQSAWLAGCLDIDASEKAARFVRTCDAFGIPILTLVDVPGYLPGKQQERSNVIGAGAKLMHAYCEAVVPKVAVVLRKAYGGAYPTLANRSATDMIYAFPSAEISVMGPEAAVDVIFRKALANAPDAVEHRGRLIEEYRDAHASARYSASRTYIEGLVEPAELRNTVTSTFALLRDKIPGAPSRRHSNIQL